MRLLILLFFVGLTVSVHAADLCTIWSDSEENCESTTGCDWVGARCTGESWCWMNSNQGECDSTTDCSWRSGYCREGGSAAIFGSKSQVACLNSIK